MALNKSLTSKFMNRMFRRVGGLVWDLTTGKTGIKDENGIYTLEVTAGTDGAADTTQIVVNPFDAFGMDLPAFATSTKLSDVTVGDIIVGDSKILGFVVEVKDASLVLLDKAGMRKQYNPPKVAVFGTDNNVLVVKNLMSVAGGETGLAGLQGNLLPLVALGGDLDLESILPFMLMSGGNAGAAGGLNAMLPLLLLNKGKSGGLGGIDPMLMLAMSGGFGGGAGGMNPMMLLALTGGLDSKEPVELPTPAVRGAIPALSRTTRS
jgi:hypothetical protein